MVLDDQRKLNHYYFPDLSSVVQTNFGIEKNNIKETYRFKLIQKVFFNRNKKEKKIRKQ